MNRIFNFSRFGRYLLYDLRNAKNNAGFTLTVYGLAPIFAFLFYELCSLIFSGMFANMGAGLRLVFLLALVFIFSMMIPGKLYGRVTDKRYGTEFLMLPASTFEKFLSMVLITAVLFPLCLILMLLVSDTLLGLIFPSNYGTPLLFMDNAEFFGINPLSITVDTLTINFFLAFVCSWMLNTMVFTLGAIFFKKSKVAKTLLIYMLVGLLLGSCFITLVMHASAISADMFMIYDLQSFERTMNFVFNLWYSFATLLFLGLIYWRLKVLKH